VTITATYKVASLPHYTTLMADALGRRLSTAETAIGTNTAYTAVGPLTQLLAAQLHA